MNYRQLIYLLIITITLVGSSYLVLNQNTPQAKATQGVSISLTDAQTPMSLKTTAELIDFWHARTERNPRDFISLSYLGAAFLRQGQETGDVSAYQRAEAALDRALTLKDNDELALAFKASVLLAGHNFLEARDLAQRVYNFDPRALHALATLGDAQLELGNYAEAEAAYRQLVEKNPSPPVYGRLARLAWLHGHPDEAINTMSAALDSAINLGLTGESLAWYRFQLGELYFNTGQLDRAEQNYQAALADHPAYYLGLAGMGKVRAAQGDYQTAIDYYQRSTAIIPNPEFLAVLGDLYTLTGQIDQAQQQYDTVRYIGKLSEINRQIYNRQLANFYSDRGQNVQAALRLAVTELDVRQDIYGYDASAWAYYKNGLIDQAGDMIDQAMRLGTQDAKLYYHAGMIAHAAGRQTEAKTLLTEALTINPHFDLLQVGIAQTTLAQLAATSALIK
ncbi:MAG: tetratricopeptide repeat protein [Anaerolineae bacterium]|nr:tetratricopeptide repeat protein [Anaerolineae bacterium]